MSIKTFIALALATTLPLASLFFTVGCESAEDHSIDITPAYSEVSKVGQSVRLSAKGWSDYTWSLSNTDIGTLSSTHGESVVYVVRTIATNSTPSAIEQTVTVTARNIGTSSSSNSGSNTTTTVSSIYTGEAVIKHLFK